MHALFLKQVFCGLLGAIGLLLTAHPSNCPATPPEGFDVVTLNIRHGSAKDGPDHWQKRGPELIDFMRENQWDIILLQEAEDFQINQISDALESHAVITRGREDGLRKGEHVPILFNRRRFTLLAADTFWLSDTPETPGSRSWGNQIPRICTWGRLLERDQSTPLTVINVHLDHRSQPSRLKSIQQILGFAEREIRQGHHVIIGGDFNAAEDNPVHRQLADSPTPWTNVHRSLNPSDPRATDNGFDLHRRLGKPIDFLYTSPGLKPKTASIIQPKTSSGRWLSDHFPVQSYLSFQRE